MADYGASFRRTSSGSNREDPRLSRRDSNPTKEESSPGKPPSNWQNHYSTMQTSYQHLQGTMYSDPNQYSTQGYQNAYSGYTNYNAPGYSSYEGYGREHQATGYGPTPNMQPGPPGDEYPQGGWAPVTGYVSNQQQTSGSSTEKQHHSDGIAQEIEHQKAELIKQRDEYNKRVSLLRKELELLRRQKQQLMQDHKDHKSDRDTEMILRENGKLQIEIQNKLKDAYKVIDIFTGLIGDEGRRGRKEADSVTSSPSSKSKRQPTELVNDSRCNYVHYDPELHWCRMCDVFPKTAKDLLIHLQSKEHRANVQEDEAPWHKLPQEQEFPYKEGAATKRHPIKGLQFFVATTGWYCRLCDTWIGDLHCASLHLKSIKHSQNYSNFVEQNPHWEIEWLKDREKSLNRMSRHNKSSDSEDSHDTKKKKHKKHASSPNQSRDKRKKKKSKKRRKDSSDSSSSSSSSSSSEDEANKDTTKSIHVAMRNKMKLQAQMLMNEELSGKWEAIGRLVEERKKKEAEIIVEKHEEDQMINQWMTVKQPQQDKDKALLSNLKDRLKQKQEAEKVKFAEMERKRLEKEKEEREMKEREEKEAREREEAKRKERDDLDRLKEIREQVKFKTRGGGDKERHRRKRSTSRSPEYKRRDSSPGGDHRRRGSPDKHRRYENGNRSSEYEENSRHKRKYDDKKPPPPPPYKKLPFIGRMPLFKNKKMDDKTENREVKKEDYDLPRPSRFQPGTLARAFIPEPEVVCFPKLSSYPELAPPPPPVVPKIAEPPAPPKISETIPKTPPPPKIKPEDEVKEKIVDETVKDLETVDNTTVEDMMIMEDENTMNPMSEYQDPGYDHYYDYTMMYQPPVFDYNMVSDNGEDQSGMSSLIPLSHTMPLQPPPLPPDDPNDDLAMLGISSDDLAVQMVNGLSKNVGYI